MPNSRNPVPEAERDPVTGLPGLDSARQRLEEWIRAAHAPDGQMAVHALLLGLRRFDAINLAYGASAGDGALAEVAARMSHFAADELDCPWFLARGSGGNFLLVANEACSRERWQLLAGQLADAIARPIAGPGGSLRLSPRIALLRAMPGENAESLLDRLGQTLALARRQQGRRLLWADREIVRAGRTAAQLEADLLRAIDRDEIEIAYQPQFACVDDRLGGAEALARWQHPKLGRIGAGALFTIAERADHLGPLSRHIARLALDKARDWPEPLRLSLNVTAGDLAAANYAEDFLALLAATGFPPGRLTIEVTEQALLGDIQLAATALGRLAGAGIRIALDDFGAGFCNFRYLKILPLHYLKLDRTMVDGIPGDARDLAVLRGIVAMARALDLSVIAEGIESEEQREAIAAEGCDWFQGFLKAQPMRGEEFLKLAGGGDAAQRFA